VDGTLSVARRCRGITKAGGRCKIALWRNQPDGLCFRHAQDSASALRASASFEEQAP
jgi:hypothetical protein